MDLLAEVKAASKKLAQAEDRYLEAMHARNLAIKAAVDGRHTRVDVARATGLNPEQVRRIYNRADQMPGRPTTQGRGGLRVPGRD